ncbi:MAG TPA: hypothetical protein DEP18_05405 [Flavobacteriales bacterium]|nr:hypothetical protein [Flavobacteriales bacterium]
MRLVVCIFLGVHSLCSFGQNMNTDIWTLDIELKPDSVYFSNPQNITSGHKGYDNQPWFSPDGKYIFYTAMTEHSTTDIFRYEIEGRKSIQLTTTPRTSEYSPRITTDGTGISVVRVEEDGTTQRLWRFDLNGKKPKKIAPWLDSVGYYQFLSGELIVAFILGPAEQHGLRLINLKTKEEQVICNHVGRWFSGHLLKIPTRETSYENHTIGVYYTLSTASKSLLLDFWMNGPDMARKLIQLPEGAQDLLALTTGWLASSGDEIWFLSNQPNSDWKPLPRKGFPSLKGISRMAIHPNGKTIALVCSE